MRLPSCGVAHKVDIVLCHSVPSKQTHIYSRYTFVSVLSTSLDIGNSVLYAAILDFPLPVKSYNIYRDSLDR